LGATFASTTDALVPTLLENDNTNKIFEPAVAINPDGSRGAVAGI